MGKLRPREVKDWITVTGQCKGLLACSMIPWTADPPPNSHLTTPAGGLMDTSNLAHPKPKSWSFLKACYGHSPSLSLMSTPLFQLLKLKFLESSLSMYLILCHPLFLNPITTTITTFGLSLNPIIQIFTICPPHWPRSPSSHSWVVSSLVLLLLPQAPTSILNIGAREET